MTKERIFAKHVRRLRAERGFSKSSFARAVGVSPTCVWNWEEGNTEPRPETLAKVAQVLKTTTDHLLGGATPVTAAIVAPSHSLADIIQKAREEIAAAAGLDSEDVRITLNYG